MAYTVDPIDPGSLDDGMPVLGGDSDLRPIRHRAALAAQARSQLRRATNGLDDRSRIHESGLPEILAIINPASARGRQNCWRDPASPSSYVSGMNSKPLEGLGNRLKAIREERGLSPQAMADWLGVGRTRYVNWEKEENRPAEEKMAWLCDETGVTLDYIYRGRLDAMPMALGIRLRARELGQVPDGSSSDLSALVDAALAGARRA